LSAHEHYYERISLEEKGKLTRPVYVITGGGGADLAGRKCNKQGRNKSGTRLPQGIWYSYVSQKYNYVKISIGNDIIVSVMGTDAREGRVEFEKIDEFEVKLD
jgi:hypothetical protein